MTKILKDRGFVLKTKKFRETSKLITIFSENAGKLNLVARGVRTPKSKTSAVLEPMNFIEFVYYEKPTRDLQYISSADFINDYSTIKSDFEKIKIAYIIIELTNLFSREGQSNEELFNLVNKTLTALDKSLKSNYQLLIEFLIYLCEITGYPVYSGQCPVCHNSIDILKEDFGFTQSYGIVCLRCKVALNNKINLGNETKRLLSMFLVGNYEQLGNSEERFKHLYIPILEFLQFHVEEIKKIKSLELF